MNNTNALANGINTLTFQYYDKNGATVSGSATNLHYVRITLNVTQNNANYTITSGVYLRDLSS